MKYLLMTLFLWAGLSYAQRDLTPNSKKNAFGGARSFKEYNPYGIQFQLGGTYLMTAKKNDTKEVDLTTGGFRGNYAHDPNGKLGAYAEIGMFHFPKRFPKLKISKDKTIVLLSYYDWGLGFKYFRGEEDININFTDAFGTPTSTEEQNYQFANGNVFGRFSLHKNQHFHPKKRDKKLPFFLDHSLGINFDYRVLTNTDDYTGNSYSILTSEQQYYKPFHAQLHYGLGFGFSPKRGSFIIPGVRLPILGYQTTSSMYNGDSDKSNHFGNPSLHWFSSRYWPILFHVKFMFALPKKSKGCKTGITNEQDKETQKGR